MFYLMGINIVGGHFLCLLANQTYFLVNREKITVDLTIHLVKFVCVELSIFFEGGQVYSRRRKKERRIKAQVDCTLPVKCNLFYVLYL